MPQIYTIEINITCVPLYFWGRRLNSAESVGVRMLTKAVPDASSHSFFKCPTYGAGELLVPPLSGLAEKKQRVRKKKRAGKKQHLPGETIQGIGGRERRVKWVQFQRGNNGGRGVWCSYPGHENDSVDDGINHTSAALNVNEDMFACFLAFLITIASIQPSSRPDEGGGGRLICSHAGWYRLTEAIIFEMFLLSLFLRSLLLLCFCCDEWAQGQNGVYPLISPASPDKRNAHSRWHYFGVCSLCAIAPFISCELKFTTYPLTGGVNISNMT